LWSAKIYLNQFSVLVDTLRVEPFSTRSVSTKKA
jgi:hypothetical protein